MIKFGLITDTHLDYAQFGLDSRRRDFAASFIWAIEDMIREGVDAILHSGDIIHSNKPTPHCLRVLQECQAIMEEARVTMYVVSGNHDYTEPHWLTVANPDASRYGFKMLDFLTLNIEGVIVRGIPNMSRDAFLKQPWEASNILLIHQSIQEFIGFPSNSALTIEELPDCHDVIAIGDTHVYADAFKHPKNERTLVISGGSTELYSIAEDEAKFWTELRFEMNGDSAVFKGHEKHLILTRPVVRHYIKTSQDVDTLIANAKAAVIERHPIVIATFLHTVPDVVKRLRSELNPDEFILRLKPEFDSSVKQRVGEVEPTVDEEKEISVEDVLRAYEPEDSAVFHLVKQGLNTAVDFNAAADTWINERLRKIGEPEIV